MCLTQNLVYVYLLRSKKHPDRHYTGLSMDPEKRLLAHNRGKSSHTSKYSPWYIDVLIGIRDEEKAKAFELYLKPHSGRAYSSKHF